MCLLWYVEICSHLLMNFLPQMSFFDPVISCGVECAWDVVLLLSYLLTESMLLLLLLFFCQVVSCLYGAVLCCISFDPCGSVRVDVGFAIVGFGGLKSGLTLNHVSPVHGCPFLPVLAEGCAVAPQSPLLFHLSFVLLFSCSLQACPLELDSVCQVCMLLVIASCVVSQGNLGCCKSKCRCYLSPTWLLLESS